MSQNIEIIKGDDTLLKCTFTDENDDSVDISNADLVFTVKEDFSSAAALSVSVASGLHTSPTDGITQILLPHDDTDIDAGNYFWDIQLTYGSGIINSVSRGKITIRDDITN